MPEISLAFVELPIEPTYFVVLAIGIVVAILRMAEFVTAANHWHALRQHYRRDESSHLAFSQGGDLWILRRPFLATIPTQIVAVAIAIVVFVSFVVLVVVADQIIETESVVRRHKIDARIRLPSVVCVQVTTAA